MKNVKRADNLIEQFKMRERAKFFNAICQYTHRQQTAKRYWTKILNRMDAHMKRRAMKMWNENSHSTYSGRL